MIYLHKLFKLFLCILYTLFLLFCRIFLVDHAWTFEAEYAKRQLQSSPDLFVRIAEQINCMDENDDGNFIS